MRRGWCGGAHAISAPPPNEKKLRKKDEAANAMLSPNTIWMSRRNPPAVSPNARVRPVTMMIITATILATGPCTDSRICWSGSSQGMPVPDAQALLVRRSEEHTSELQSLMRISYAVFCLKKKRKKIQDKQCKS